MKFSFSVLALNFVSAITSGAGIYVIAKDAPQLTDTPRELLFLSAVAGTMLIQMFINGGWKPYFEGHAGITGAIIGGIASSASLISATAGWLMMFDSVGLQRDLQAAAVAPHTQVLQTHEVRYIDSAARFAALSTEMAAKALRESTTGPACANDSAATWKKKCGPRCRFMNRQAQATDTMSHDAQRLADRMSSITRRLNTGSQAEIDAAYTEALQLQSAPEMASLRQGVRSLKSDLTGSITDPETGTVFACRMPDTLAFVTEADAALSEVMLLPSRPTRPEPQVDDSMVAAVKVVHSMAGGEASGLRAGEKTSFALALVVELLLLLCLRRDARREAELATRPLEPEQFENARPKEKLRHPEKIESFLAVLDRYTVNGGRWGQYFAVPYDGDNSDFRTQCLEVVDYLSIPPARRASNPIDMRGIFPEWVNARARENGQATHFELYSLSGPIARWRQVVRRALRAMA
jgi:hypothetical protein